MGEWVIGALINLFGSIAINYGTNLLKLGHDERKKHLKLKPIVYFKTWRTGILIFGLGNCLNFISFGYAAQSILSALGSIQFVSNIAFAYYFFKKKITIKLVLATAFIVTGNIFLVAFGNHQSLVYKPEQLVENYKDIVFLLYCLTLVLIIASNQSICKRGVYLIHESSKQTYYWNMLLPFSYAVVSGAIGSCSVLFAKSLSSMLRLYMSSSDGSYSMWHDGFTYSMVLMFLSTAGFWMARLNEGLSQFDAVLIVPMFQIAWTFFSICTGFVYFQEYKEFDGLRTSMFILGMVSVFVGIYLLAPSDECSKGDEAVKDVERIMFISSKESEIKILDHFEDLC